MARWHGTSRTDLSCLADDPGWRAGAGLRRGSLGEQWREALCHAPVNGEAACFMLNFSPIIVIAGDGMAGRGTGVVGELSPCSIGAPVVGRGRCWQAGVRHQLMTDTPAPHSYLLRLAALKHAYRHSQPLQGPSALLIPDGPLTTSCGVVLLLSQYRYFLPVPRGGTNEEQHLACGILSLPFRCVR